MADLVLADWGWSLANFCSHAPTIGLPPTPAEARAAAAADVPINKATW